MPQNMNKIMIEGRLGKDPELRYSPSGAAFCNCTMATTFKWKDKGGENKELTDWHNFVISGKSGEAFAKFHKKGDIAYVEGRQTYRVYEDRDGVKRESAEIRVSDWAFCSGNDKREATPQQQRRQPPPTQTPPQQTDDDEIPF